MINFEKKRKRFILEEQKEDDDKSIPVLNVQTQISTKDSELLIDICDQATSSTRFNSPPIKKRKLLDKREKVANIFKTKNGVSVKSFIEPRPTYDQKHERPKVADRIGIICEEMDKYITLFKKEEETPQNNKRILEDLIVNTEAQIRSFLPTFLPETPREVLLKDLEKFEIEFRLGELHPLGFRSGISSQEYDLLNILLKQHKRIQQENITSVTKTTIVQVHKDYMNGVIYRIEKNASVKRFTASSVVGTEKKKDLIKTKEKEQEEGENMFVLKKEKLFTKDLKDPFKFNKDVRLSLATEEKISFLPDNVVKTCARKKKRTSYQFKTADQNLLWSLDLTAIDMKDCTEGSSKNIKQSYEVELELEPGFWVMYMREDRNEALNYLFDCWKMIQKFFKKVSNAIKKNDPFPDLKRTETPSDQAYRLKQICLAGTRAPQDANFGGVLPVAFSRKFFTIVQKNPYFVSDKPDGIRYLLLVYENEVYLHERKGHCLKIQLPNLVERLSQEEKQITLLDGELVRDYAKNDIVFLAFDIFTCKNVSLVDHPLSKRLEILNDLLNGLPFKEGQEGDAFRIVPKLFYPVTDIKLIFSKIQMTSKGRFFVGDPRCIRKIDGLILSPDAPYSKNTKNIYKWKPLDELTVDFGIISPEQAPPELENEINMFFNISELWENELHTAMEINESPVKDDTIQTTFTSSTQSEEMSSLLRKTAKYKERECKRPFYALTCVDGKGREIVCRHTRFTSEEQITYRDYLISEASQKNAISVGSYPKRHVGEFFFNIEKGCWELRTIRKDKNTPNYVHVLADTLQAIAENITEEELKIKLSNHPEISRKERKKHQTQEEPI